MTTKAVPNTRTPKAPPDAVIMKFFFRPTSRIHLPDLGRLLEVRHLEVGQQNPLQRFGSSRRIWFPDTNRHTNNRFSLARTMSVALRGADDQWREAHAQLVGLAIW